MSNEAGRTLILVRHAKTEQPTGGMSDHERELLPRGVGDARAAGAWIVEHGLVPHLVLCSSAARAQQTWQEMAEGGQLRDVEVWTERRIYNAYPEEILHVVHEAPEDAGVVMVVGHAPGIPSLATGLADSDTSDGYAWDELCNGMPTSSAAILEFTGRWTDLVPESARLTGFHTWRRPQGDTA